MHHGVQAWAEGIHFFIISEIEMDQDHSTEGFATVD
jgi:hypothetical protein